MKRLLLLGILLLIFGCNADKPLPKTPQQTKTPENSMTNIKLDIKGNKVKLESHKEKIEKLSAQLDNYNKLEKKIVELKQKLIENKELKKRIKKLEDNGAKKAPIQIANIDKLIKILGKIEAEKKASISNKKSKSPLPSNEIVELTTRIKKLECDYKQPYKAYKDGIVKDIFNLCTIISLAVAIFTVVIAIGALGLGFYELITIKKAREEATRNVFKTLAKIRLENRKTNNEIKNDIDGMKKEAKTNKCNSAVGFARIICDDKDNEPEKERTIKELEEFITDVDFKDNLRLFVVKARLHKRVGEYDEAVKVIDTFLRNVDYMKLDDVRKKDFQIEVFLYNKSCYKALLAEQKNSKQEKNEALELLNQAKKLDEDFIESAWHDDDFKFIRDKYPAEFTKALET